MIDKDKVIKLMNRDSGSVGYSIPDSGIHRSFAPGEIKNITFKELESLSWADGGKQLLRDYLIILDKDAAEEILGHIEPEYFYTEETVKKLLKEGTLDQLKDALDFAPKGVIDLIKEQAVKTKLDSSVKREAIQEATHFNVSNSIELNLSEDTNEKKETSQRRSAPVEEKVESNPERRSKYLVIDQK